MQPLSRTDDPLGDPQKENDCGNPAQTRTTRIATYKPGDTITVTWQETIDHPGWFRIAFQPSGEGFRAPAASTGPNSAGTASNFPTEDLTGMTDPDGTGSMILKDRIPDGTLTATVTLPNMECTNCTLQLIQVMTQTATYEFANDVYFQCADITLAANAPDAGVSATDPDAGTDPGTGGVDPGKVSGGCQTGGGSGAPVALVLLGLVGLRRRRR
jgi:MYXO-CTERM domain-containing protein